MHRRPRLALLPALPLALAVAVAGCGSGGSDALASFAGASITIQARGLEFNPDIVTAPSGVPLRLVLDNQDQGVGHNLHVFQGDTDLGQSPTVIGPGTAVVELPPLAPGRYQFDCTLHPDMIGTIIVAPGASAGPSDPGDTLPPDSLPPYSAPPSLPPDSAPPPLDSAPPESLPPGAPTLPVDSPAPSS